VQGANLLGAQVQGANLIRAQLQGANLMLAQLQGADLKGANLQGTLLVGAHLEDADLTSAFLDGQTVLDGCQLIENGGCPMLADVHWNGASLIQLDWDSIGILTDEHRAKERHEKADPKKKKDHATRADEFQDATRAYRLLSTALRAQGVIRPATRFHYRAELMDRKALYQQAASQWRTKGIKVKLSALATRGRWMLSFILGVFSGYGDQLWRLFLTYASVVLGFAAAMLIFAVQVKENQPFSPATIQDVLVLSVTSFHGRGVQPPGLHVDDALATLAGAEAVFGLLIEGLFIAAFTRRVTGN
jgi:hypothetical protein